MITQQLLKSLLHYNPENGVFRWRSSKSNNPSDWHVAGCLDNGYVIIRINSRGYKAHRLAWLYVYGIEPPKFIDHINRVRNDNRISNLRLASVRQNNVNTKQRSDNKSGLRGVSRHKCGKWVAQCNINGTRKHLGLFDSIEAAHSAYKKAAAATFGEFFAP